MRAPTDFDIELFHERVRRFMAQQYVGTERYPGRCPMDFEIELDRPWYPYRKEKPKKGGNMFGIESLKEKVELLNNSIDDLQDKSDRFNDYIREMVHDRDRKRTDLRFLNERLGRLELKLNDILSIQGDQGENFIEVRNQNATVAQSHLVLKQKLEDELRDIWDRLGELEIKEQQRNSRDDAYALVEEFKEWYADFVRGDESPEAFNSFVRRLRKKYRITKV